MGGQLQPLQQTIFEKGQQNTFTPPPVANVYQEGKTIFPSPEARITSSGIDWYGIGANAFRLAADAYGNTVDYLINSKIAGVKDAQDEAQSKLYEIETAISTEQYNANHERRPRQEDMVDRLVQQANDIKAQYNNKVTSVLGKDYNTLMSPDLDMKTLGSKYQELALTGRSSDRNVDRVYNRMVYMLERTLRGTQKTTELNNAWRDAGGKRDKTNASVYTNGTASIPTDKDGVPVIGAVKNPSGTGWTPIIDPDTKTPALTVHDDGQPYLNIGAINALPDDQIKLLIEMEKRNAYLISPSRGEFTEECEQLAMAWAHDNNTGNPAIGYFIGNALASYPEQVANNVINKIPKLSPEGKMKLQFATMAAREGQPRTQFSFLTNLKDADIAKSYDDIQAIVGAGSGVVNANPQDTARQARLNRTVDATVNWMNAHGANLDPNTFHFDVKDSAGNTVNGFIGGHDTNGMTIGAFLQKNPEVVPYVVRAVQLTEQNKTLTLDAKGNLDPTKWADVYKKVLQEQLNDGGW